MTFRESLNTSVAFSSEGGTASADGGNIKALELRLLSYGFAAKVRIWVIAEEGEDSLFPIVCCSTPVEVELTLAKALYNTSPVPKPLLLCGLLTARRLREVAAPDLKGSPILYREYELEFCDVACALWTQHRPCAVFAKTSVDTVVRENTPSKLLVKSQWAIGKRVRPTICLGLGMDQASFYDWIFWLADREYGHIWYDYGTRNLILDDAKPRSVPAEALAFGAIERTASYQVTLAPPPREAVQLLNSRDGATSKWEVEQPSAVDGVRRDYLIHTSLDGDARERQATEKQRHAGGRFEVRITCDAYPEMYLTPGSLLTIAGEFGEQLYVSGKTLRVVGLELRAAAANQTPEHDIESESTEYEVDCVIDLESADDPRWRGPRYLPPHYPLRIEGKIVSAVGQTTDRAYTVYADADTGDTYKVNFPLWNCTITIPMTPDFLPGHLYFPAYKDARVFVSLDFDSARIERFLDWGKDVTVPSASQGNHVLLGKNATSETSIKHWYVDNSPELIIRRTHSGDLGTVTVKEGTLTLELTEQEGGLGFGSSVSVEPQAQMAKAESQQKADLAVADLQDATATAQTKLTTQVNQTAAGLRQQAEQLSTEVDTRSRAVDEALGEVGNTIESQAQDAERVFVDTRRELEDLLK
jgi:hypothetical protein